MISARTFIDLSKEADYQLFQGIAAGYNWGWTSLNPPALSTVSQIQGSFGTQAQAFETGKTYLALFSGYDTDGLRASVFTVGSDGTSITWDASKRWEIPLGAQIRMPNGAVYLAVAKPTAGNTPIYECVKPIAGRIPLEYDNKNITFSGLKDVEIYLRPVDSSQGNYLFFNNLKNTSIYLDTSRVSSYESVSVNVYADERGASPLSMTGVITPAQDNGGSYGFNQRAYRPIINLNGSSNPEISPTLMQNPFNNFTSDGSACWSNFKFSQNVEEGLDRNILTMNDGTKKKVRFNMVWDFGYSGELTATPLVCFDSHEATASASAIPMMVKAMSSEPEMTQEEFNEIVKDKKGIFTIKDGKAYDLLTGEYVD